jgi:hypothetical protein
MNGDGGGRYDDDEKIIDITDYVNKKSDEEIQMEEFTSHFVDMFNQRIVDKQREEARKNFIHFMINFLLCTQVAVIVAICFLIAKIY